MPRIGQTALSIAARKGDAALFDQLQKVAETSTNPELQEGALRLLAQFEDPALVKRSDEYAISGKVRNQDAAIQLAIGLQIDATRDQTWEFIKEPLGCGAWAVDAGVGECPGWFNGCVLLG